MKINLQGSINSNLKTIILTNKNIVLFYCNQMHPKYEHDESVIKTIIYRYTTPTDSNKRLWFIVYNKKNQLTYVADYSASKRQHYVELMWCINSFAYFEIESPSLMMIAKSSLLRGKTPPNECSGYSVKQSDGEAPVYAGALGTADYPFIAIAPRPTLARSGSTW